MQSDWQLFILRLLVCEVLPCWRKFTKLMPYHVLGDGHILVVLAIVYLELQPNEAREYRGRARLCSDRGEFLAGFGSNDGYWQDIGSFPD